MTRIEFLDKYSELLLDEELLELNEDDNKIETIYYPGLILQRTEEKLQILKEVNDERC